MPDQPRKVPDIPGDDPLESLRNTEFPIGSNAAGEIVESFPMSELSERKRKQASESEAWQSAMAASAAGFPENEDPEFMSDYAALAAKEGETNDDG